MTNQKRGAAKLFYAAKEKREGAAQRPAPRQGDQSSRRPGRERPPDAAMPAEPAPAEPRSRPKGPPGARDIDQCAAAFQALLRAGLAYPGTYQDHPWGHTVVKLKNKKVFVFLGAEDGGLSVTCKLPHSGAAALSLLPFAAPTGYGLGKSGWVTAQFKAGEPVPQTLLLDWLAESHEAVAPTPARQAQKKRK